MVSPREERMNPDKANYLWWISYQSAGQHLGGIRILSMHERRLAEYKWLVDDALSPHWHTTLTPATPAMLILHNRITLKKANATGRSEEPYP